MKTRNIISILFLLVATQVLTAQNSTDVLVRGIVEQLRAHKNLELQFNYQISPDGKNFSDVEKGKAWLQGEAYRIEMADQQTFSDGKTIWSYLIDEEEVMVSNASEGEDNTPLKLLTSLDQNYAATIAKIDEKGVATIEMANPKGQFRRITLKINTKATEIKGVDIYAEDGSKVVLTVEEMKFDQDLDDKFFTFDEKAHPNVDVIDMR